MLTKNLPQNVTFFKIVPPHFRTQKEKYLPLFCRLLKVWFAKYLIETHRANFTFFGKGNQALTMEGFLGLPAILVVLPTSS